LKALELATAKSDLTGEYIKAVDVAIAILRSIKKRPTKSRIRLIAEKVGTIRRIIDVGLRLFYFERASKPG
jgi:hypothetical protein